MCGRATAAPAAVSFLREKFLEFGGPNGGNGGRGGDVIVTCVDGLNTLIDYRYQQHFKASTGTHGMGKDRHGAKGKDVLLRVPVGTQIFEDDNETLIADFTEVGQTVTLLPGGNGGFGNAHFKTSANQAPRHANPGQDGAEKWIWLRLKLIADAGLVGLPNAGKSTFLAAVSAAKPKIADYPFTTLHPNLGVVRIGERDFVLADIPGLIEGAHEGAGIGDRFLGHIERCAVLIHLIDGTDDDVKTAYKTIRHELEAYDERLAEKPEIVVLNKIDALIQTTTRQKVMALKRVSKAEVFAASGVTGKGVRRRPLPDRLAILERKRQAAADAARPGAARPGRRHERRPRPLSPAHHQDRLRDDRRRHDRQDPQRMAGRPGRGFGCPPCTRATGWSSSPPAPLRWGAACWASAPSHSRWSSSRPPPAPARSPSARRGPRALRATGSSPAKFS